MGEKLEINENFFLVRKPHFRKKEHHLFFLISKRPFLELSPEEEDIWLKTEKEIPIKDILRDNSKNRKEAVQKLLEKKILEKLPPFPLNSRKEVAVIEPHMDDAALSVGGTMLLNKEHFRFTILSVAGNCHRTPKTGQGGTLQNRPVGRLG